ncbi:hypothetical protein D3C84_786610 [compost metagenome]
MRLLGGRFQQRVDQLQEEDQALQPLRGTYVFEQSSGLDGRCPGKLQAATGVCKQVLQLTQLRQGAAQGQQGCTVKLQHHIAPAQVFTGRQVAYPVMGQVGTDQRDMPRAKRTDVIAGDQLAAALADQISNSG